jgi:heparinase II/III-like protein
MRGRLALIRRLPAKVVMQRALGLVGRTLGAAIDRQRDRQRPTHCGDPPDGALVPLIGAVARDALHAAGGWIVPAAELYRRHHFDLLGSGWLRNTYGIACRGVEGHRYEAAPAVDVDRDGRWLSGRINPANLAASQRIWRLVDGDYQPIDWQLDMKSGYRWRESQWAADITIGELPGADVKLPWELARMQHLAVLAWAYGLARDGSDGLRPEGEYLAAFRNQILDFIATNPPRFGINWRCTMDVAIRAASWVVAHDLMRSMGARLDDAFTAILKASLVDHGRHIVSHLEIYPEGRGNHYLADIAGLAFIAAALPRSRECDGWLAFAVQELVAETEYQFHPDGANFEASTSYHRLAAEMVLFASALIVGLSADKQAAIATADPASLHTRPPRRLASARAALGPPQFARLALAAQFSRAATKPSGRVAQIGDNDSGRFLKLHPIFALRSAAEARQLYANLDAYGGLPDDAAYPDEETLDHRPTIAAIAALTDRPELAADAGGPWLDAVVVTALCAGRRGHADVAIVDEAARRRTQPRGVDRVAALGGPGRVTELVAPGGDLRQGLQRRGFGDFGLWIFRSERLFLAIRCGPIGHGGRGAHAHNDQLAIELAIDGEDWIADPGSYLYTPLPELRNAYRSVRAHFAPQSGGREPGRLDLGNFWLGDEAQAQCLVFADERFVGEHRGYGTTVRRSVTIGETSLSIHDIGMPADADAEFVRCVGRRELAARFPAACPFSPGYGKRYPLPNSA